MELHVLQGDRVFTNVEVLIFDTFLITADVLEQETRIRFDGTRKISLETDSKTKH